MLYEEYERLKKLQELLDNRTISEEEYEQEKAKFINDESQKPVSEVEEKPVVTDKKPLFGLDESLYLLLMHLSQFVSAFIVPLVMWLIGKDESKRVDAHGKNIMNFIITYAIWTVVGIITIPIIVGIVILSVIGLVVTISIIVASVKAYNDEDWGYPLTIKFFR
ncbi:MAG: DUF4870 domain-containing protein [Paludibacteraceae bacterium]